MSTYYVPGPGSFPYSSHLILRGRCIPPSIAEETEAQRGKGVFNPGLSDSKSIPACPSQLAKGLDSSRGGAGGQEVSRTLTEALHGVRAEDPAGPLWPEVVAGNIFTVAPAEHQLVAVLFLLRFHILMGQGPLFGHFSSVPLPRARQPRQA